MASPAQGRATRLKSYDGRWLSDREESGGLSTEQYLYDNGRYLETRTYDPRAPDYRRWSVIVRDRQTGAQATVTGLRQRTATRTALRQVGR